MALLIFSSYSGWRIAPAIDTDESTFALFNCFIASVITRTPSECPMNKAFSSPSQTSFKNLARQLPASFANSEILDHESRTFFAKEAGSVAALNGRKTPATVVIPSPHKSSLKLEDLHCTNIIGECIILLKFSPQDLSPSVIYPGAITTGIPFASSLYSSIVIELPPIFIFLTSNPSYISNQYLPDHQDYYIGFHNTTHHHLTH
ncbi:hypothetical protein D3C73_784310 [compost metagenome]